MASSFATLILVGPGELVSSRLHDVILSLFVVEPNCVELVLIDDGMACSPQEIQTWIPKSCGLTIIKNPRNGLGDGWSDGTTVGALAGLRHLAGRDDISFILRLDDDSVVFGRFSDRLASFFQKNPECGMAGTFRRYPNGDERKKGGFMVERQVSPRLLMRFLARLMLETRKPQLFFTTIRRRTVIRGAQRNGYQNGEYVQGGGHAFSPALLRTLLSNRLLDDPFLFFSSRIADDQALTILCYSVGFIALDYNGSGEVFAVQNNGIPNSPDALAQNGYAIAHSVKADPRWPESEIRKEFSKVRQKSGL